MNPPGVGGVGGTPGGRGVPQHNSQQGQQQGRRQSYPKANNESFYFVFSQIWPAGYCMATEKNKCDRLLSSFPTNMWTVRGFWVATKKYGQHQRYCRSVRKKMIKTLTVQYPGGGQRQRLISKPSWQIAAQMAIDIDRIWPSLEPGDTPANRWVEEWQTYGMCTGLGLEGYFGTVINLHQQYSVFNILASANIYPDDLYTFSTSAMKRAIRDAYGFEADLYCRRRRMSANGRFSYVNILQEVRFCFDVELQPTNCPTRPSRVGQILMQNAKSFPCAFDTFYPKYTGQVRSTIDHPGGVDADPGMPAQAQVFDQPAGAAGPPAYVVADAAAHAPASHAGVSHHQAAAQVGHQDGPVGYVVVAMPNGGAGGVGGVGGGGGIGGVGYGGGYGGSSRVAGAAGPHSQTRRYAPPGSQVIVVDPANMVQPGRRSADHVYLG